MPNYDHILEKLPYQYPFRFVDALHRVDATGAEGSYTFPENSFFYEGHFVGNPVTPGVILTEVMAQIGVVCLGIFLLGDQINARPAIALTTTNVDFYKPVFPGETVTVRSVKDYFRFQKLQCNVEMLNQAGERICRGTISGMIVSSNA